MANGTEKVTRGGLGGGFSFKNSERFDGQGSGNLFVLGGDDFIEGIDMGSTDGPLVQ